MSYEPDAFNEAYLDAVLEHLKEPIPADLEKLAEAVNSLRQAQIQQLRINKAVMEKLQSVEIRIPT